MRPPILSRGTVWRWSSATTQSRGILSAGGAFGTHVVRPGRVDPEAEAFFRQYGPDQVCQGQRRG